MAVQNEQKAPGQGSSGDQERAGAIASGTAASLKQVSLPHTALHSALGVDLVKGPREGGEQLGPR